MSEQLKKVTIIDKELSFRDMLKLELVYRGYQVMIVSPENIQSFLQEVDCDSQNPSIVTLGGDIPFIVHGAQSIRDKLANGAWIISLGESSLIKDKLACYEAGVSDYLVRGVEIEELVSKINAVLNYIVGRTSNSFLEYTDLKMNLIDRSVLRGSKQIELRSKEFDLLKVFLQYPEQILSREFIFNEVWGFDFLGDSNVIEVYIRYLRAKLGKPNLIKTKRGKGYVLISEESQIQKMGLPSDFY